MHFETAQAPNIVPISGGVVRPSGFTHVPGNKSGNLNKTIEIDKLYKGKSYTKYINAKYYRKNKKKPKATFYDSSPDFDQYDDSYNEKQKDNAKISNGVLHDHFYCC